MPEQSEAPSSSFHREEATIDTLHQTIKSAQTTCVAIVQRHMGGVRAYNEAALYGTGLGDPRTQ